MEKFEVREVASSKDKQKALEIRRIVFCHEQGVNPALEFDGLDNNCRHYLAKSNGRAIGTARIRQETPTTFKIERVAVLAEERRQGVGKALMKKTISDAKETPSRIVKIHAQCHAEIFYTSLGFRRINGNFEEAGIPHVLMILEQSVSTGKF